MLRLIVGITFFLTTIGLILYVLGRRLLGPLRGASRGAKIGWAIYGVYVALALFSLPLVRSLEPSLLRTMLQWAGFTAFGITALLVGFSAIRELVLGLHWLYIQLTKGNKSPEDWTKVQGRRDFLQKVTAGAVVAATAGTTAKGISNARQTAALKYVDIPVQALDPALDGLRILLMTDIHVGDTIGRKYFQAIVDRAMSVDVDLICITGDLVDGSVLQLRHDIEPIDQLQAPLGVYFVTGNHEYYSGVEDWIAELKHRGIDVLEDEHRVLERGGAPFVLAGIHDYKAKTIIPEHLSDPAKALAGAPETSLCVLMAHQPISHTQIEGLPIDLQLSGHTHGGQIWPFGLLVPLQQRFVAGLHKVYHRTWLYISRGTGYWGPPMRVGSPAEITVLTIRRA